MCVNALQHRLPCMAATHAQQDVHQAGLGDWHQRLRRVGGARQHEVPRGAGLRPFPRRAGLLHGVRAGAGRLGGLGWEEQKGTLGCGPWSSPIADAKRQAWDGRASFKAGSSQECSWG